MHARRVVLFFVALLLGVVAVGLWLWRSYRRDVVAPPEKLPPHPLGPFPEEARIIVLGLPTYGKTYLTAEMVKECPRVLFFDPLQDYAKAAGAREMEADAFIENAPALLSRPTFRIAIVPDSDSSVEAEQLADCIALARAATNVVFVMDEVGDYGLEARKSLIKLSRNGRHHRVIPIYVSQVATDIPRSVRRLAWRVHSFRQVDPDDLDALSERYGAPFAAALPTLPKRKFRTWNLDSDPLPLESLPQTPAPSSRPVARPPSGA